MKPFYGDNVEMLYTDTDSLVLNIQTDDVYEDMVKNGDWFDFSEFDPKYNRFPNMSKEETMKNCAVVGKFKDESGGKVISEFVSVKAKMYSYTSYDGSKFTSTSKGKGVPRAARARISHQQYIDCVTSSDIQSRLQKIGFHRINCKAHQIETIEQSKISLCCTDDNSTTTSQPQLETDSKGLFERRR